MTIIASLKHSWYLGKGQSASKKHNYDLALKYYIRSLNYARKTNDSYSMVVPLEAVAETFFHLKQYDDAKLYAAECLEKLSQIVECDSSRILRDRLDALIKQSEDKKNGNKK